MSKTAKLYICGAILAVLAVLGIIGHSYAKSKPPIAVLGYADGDRSHAILATCSVHDPNHLVLEIVLPKSTAEMGESIRVLVGEKMMIFETREDGIIGTAIHRELVPEFIDVKGGRFQVWVIDWNDHDILFDVAGTWAQQLPRMACMKSPLPPVEGSV